MIHPLSPTTALPALVSLHSCNAPRLKEALRVLREVYFPQDSLTNVVPVLKQSLYDAVPASRPKRAARLVHYDGVPDSGYASAEEDDCCEDEDEHTDSTENEDQGSPDLETDALDILRSDEIERNYAIRWLTGLVKRGDAWLSGAADSPEEESDRTTVIDNASRLLARFAGDDEPEEALTRTFRFPLRPDVDHHRANNHDAFPIMIEMNDAPVDGSDHTAVGLQSWGSAIVLAKRICADPERYLPPTTHTRRLHILELGAGTGMLSIVAAKVLARRQRLASILATDYHPSVLSNLGHNVRVNLPTVHSLTVDALDWSAPPQLGDAELYDVVLAADVVYDPQHASWIRGCVGKTMRKDGVFWLIMPLRVVGRHEGLEKTVAGAFPESIQEGEGVGDRQREGRLAVVHREEVDKLDGVGRADESGYTVFEIRWV